MGLAVVQGIVATYGGHILVHSWPERGTSFDVLLPKNATDYEATASSAATVPAETPPHPRNLRVLVVDDEPVVRVFLSRVLGKNQVSVVACRNASEALEAFSSATEPFDLIVTDQHMPGMSGVELARSIRSSGSEVPILIFTGYADAVSEIEISELRIAGVLMKPLRAGELNAAVASALAHGPNRQSDPAGSQGGAGGGEENPRRQR
jgi:CheY-like chemotaxis protein